MWKFISQARVFFQTMFDFFFFITSLFLLFHKNYYHFTKGKEPARSPKPDSFEFELFTVDISSRMTPARFSRALFLQVKAKQLLAQSFLTLFLLYKQRCEARSLCLGQSAAPKNPTTSEKKLEVSSVSYEQIRVATNSKLHTVRYIARTKKITFAVLVCNSV